MTEPQNRSAVPALSPPVRAIDLLHLVRRTARLLDQDGRADRLEAMLAAAGPEAVGLALAEESTEVERARDQATRLQELPPDPTLAQLLDELPAPAIGATLAVHLGRRPDLARLAVLALPEADALTFLLEAREAKADAADRRATALEAQACAAARDATREAQVEAWRRWLDQGGRDAVAAWEPVEEVEPDPDPVTMFLAVGRDSIGVGDSVRGARMAAAAWLRGVLLDPDEAQNCIMAGPEGEAERLLDELVSDDRARRIVELRGPKAAVRAVADHLAEHCLF